MLICITTAILLALLIATLIIVKKKRIKQQYNTALPNIMQLRSLITLLQKHRGMCASYLQGDQTSLEAIKILSTKTPPIIEQLNSSSIINQSPRWLGFIDHWQRLKNLTIKLSVKESFEQHTDLVTNLLYLLEDIAEQQGLDKAKFEHIPYISLLWRELPFAAEYIGQSRALGMAITTAGITTQVDKVKLGYLEKKISQIVQEVFQQIQTKSAFKSGQQQLIQLAIEACQVFTNIIKKELLLSSEVTIKPNDYFTAATQSMEAIHHLLDNELQELSEFVKSHY